MIKTDKNGVVLILVLFLIAILSVVDVEMLKVSNMENSISSIEKGYIFSYNAIKNSEAFEKALLIKDARENKYDSFFDIWSFGENVHTLNGYDRELFEGVDIDVEDECSKFPINYISDNKTGQTYRDILFRLLVNKPFKLKEKKAAEIVLSLWYWIDKEGVEKKYLSKLPEGVDNIDTSKFFASAVKNAPMDNLGELFLIKTIDSKLLYPTKKRPGLFDLLTTYCKSGKININTANRYIIAAVVPDSVSQDEAVEFADSVIKFRSDEFHKDLLKNSDWYQTKMPGFSDIVLPSGIISTKSDVFRMKICYKNAKLSVCAVEILERKKEKGGYKIKTVYKELY